MVKHSFGEAKEEALEHFLILSSARHDALREKKMKC